MAAIASLQQVGDAYAHQADGHQREPRERDVVADGNRLLALRARAGAQTGLTRAGVHQRRQRDVLVGVDRDAGGPAATSRKPSPSASRCSLSNTSGVQ